MLALSAGARRAVKSPGERLRAKISGDSLSDPQQSRANVLRKALRNKRVTALARAAGRVAANWAKVGAPRRRALEPGQGRPEGPRRARGARPGRHAGVDAKDQGDRGSPVRRVHRRPGPLPPTNVFQIFEAVKLYLNAAGFVFVMGYDQDVVSDAILHEKHYSSHVRSRDYLEKIVQIDYAVPTRASPPAASCWTTASATRGSASWSTIRPGRCCWSATTAIRGGSSGSSTHSSSSTSASRTARRRTPAG